MMSLQLHIGKRATEHTIFLLQMVDCCIKWIHEPQHITFGYNVLGIQTKTTFEGCLIDQSIKCYQLTRPAEDFYC